jgi:trans-aconitate methyltransferase
VDELLEEHLVGEEIRDVLDFGCGEGSTTFDLARTLPRAQVLGVDQSEVGITCARANYRADNLCFRCEAGDVVLGSSRYDLVTCFEVLEHVEAWQELTARLVAASKRYILVSFPTGRMRSFEVNVGHLRNFKPGEFETAISELGFRPVHSFYAGFPFYSPIFRDLCELTNSGGNSLSKGKYSFPTRRLADLIYFSFRYLSTKHRHGDQFCGLFERVLPGLTNAQ